MPELCQLRYQLLTYFGDRIRAKGNSGDIVTRLMSLDNPLRR